MSEHYLKIFPGAKRANRGVIEHDCLNPECLESWDTTDNLYEDRCFMCGSEDIVVREGFNFDTRVFLHEDGDGNEKGRGFDVHPVYIPTVLEQGEVW